MTHFPTSRGPLMTLALLLAGAVLVVLPAGPASAGNWPGHPGRTVVRHTVVPGDTVSGLSVRFHAWTRELLALNHLRPGSTLHVGRVVLIPVVDARAHPRPRHVPSALERRMWRHGWRYWQMPRVSIKRLIIAEAHRQHVPVRLALAIGWQESGWHEPMVSSDGAIGVMQLLPSSGRWMETYLGQLNLRNTRHNVRAGVRMIRVLLAQTGTWRMTAAAYYQGLAGVRKHGMYADTRAYAANVLALTRKVGRLP